MASGTARLRLCLSVGSRDTTRTLSHKRARKEACGHPSVRRAPHTRVVHCGGRCSGLLARLTATQEEESRQAERTQEERGGLGDDGAGARAAIGLGLNLSLELTLSLRLSLGLGLLVG